MRLIDPSDMVLTGRNYGFFFRIDNESARLTFLEAIPNTRLDEYDLGRYLYFNQPKPEAFGPVPNQTPYVDVIGGELNMYKMLLGDEKDILIGDKSWIAQIGAKPLEISSRTRDVLSGLFKE